MSQIGTKQLNPSALEIDTIVNWDLNIFKELFIYIGVMYIHLYYDISGITLYSLYNSRLCKIYPSFEGFIILNQQMSSSTSIGA